MLSPEKIINVFKEEFSQYGLLLKAVEQDKKGNIEITIGNLFGIVSVIKPGLEAYCHQFNKFLEEEVQINEINDANDSIAVRLERINDTTFKMIIPQPSAIKIGAKLNTPHKADWRDQIHFFKAFELILWCYLTETPLIAKFLRDLAPPTYKLLSDANPLLLMPPPSEPSEEEGQPQGLLFEEETNDKYSFV